MTTAKPQDVISLGEAMYGRFTMGQERTEAPAWIALDSSDRERWVDLARFTIGAAQDLLEVATEAVVDRLRARAVAAIDLDSPRGMFE